MPPARLIVLMRLPVAGNCKTRLIPALGPEGAAGLHEAMIQRTLREAREASKRCPIQIEVRYEGSCESLPPFLQDASLTCSRQGQGDLGQKMHRSLKAALAAGAPKAVLIGTDAPQLDARMLLRAMELLDVAPLVLTPAHDGGFCLIGSAGPVPDLAGIDWGSDRVLGQTLSRAAEIGLDYRLTETLHDVDRPEDLKHLPDDLARRVGLTGPQA